MSFGFGLCDEALSDELETKCGLCPYPVMGCSKGDMELMDIPLNGESWSVLLPPIYSVECEECATNFY